MRNLVSIYRAFPMLILLFFGTSIIPLKAQSSNVITELWSESGGIYSNQFGIPTAVDINNNLYRAGMEKQSYGGTDVILEKLDEEGELLWSANLNTSGVNFYEPSKIYEHDDMVYVTGIVTYLSNGETDFFVSKVDGEAGNVEWFVLDEHDNNDVSADILYDEGSGSIYICGTSERNGDYDMLLASYDGDGENNWLVTKDYDTHIDVGAKVALSDGNLVVNGSSQPTSTSWDIVSWSYETGGTFISETRSSGTTTSSDELSDGVVQDNYINLVGKSLQGTDNDFKMICLDANNNVLWLNTFDKNGLEDEAIAVVATSNAFVATGYATDALGDADILVRKYSQSGTLLWSNEIDGEGEDDRGVDIIEDGEGNFLVLTEVTTQGQSDVYLHYLNGSSGSVIWTEVIANDPGINENGSSLEANFDGEVYVTYEVNNLTTTESYSYTEIEFPLDDESFSKSVYLITNSGQLKDENGQSSLEERYYSQGLYPAMYFGDDFFSIQMANSSQNELQRIDFNFLNSEETHIGQLEEYEKDAHYNYYKNLGLKYEQQATFDVLGYPDIYSDIDAFVSSNSEGFKMTIVLGSGSDISDIELEIYGSTNTALSSGDLTVETINGDVTWMEPFSYADDGEIADDDCIDYELVDGVLKFNRTCSGEMAYPYIIQVKVGTGAAYSTSSIDNMDWSTFFGGNNDDGAYGVTVDSDHSIFVAGYTESTTLNTKGANLTNGVNVNNLNSNVAEQGMIIKFLDNFEIKWVTVFPDASFIKAIEAFDNLSSIPTVAPEEIHVVGELTGDFSPINALAFPHNITQPFEAAFDFGATQPDRQRDLFIATVSNNLGNIEYASAFGGDGTEFVHGMAIRTNSSGKGVLYFVGSTDHGSVLAAASRRAPGTVSINFVFNFPVFDPSDNSIFSASHPSPGNQRGFVAAMNLGDYRLDYSSIIGDFETIYDIDLGTSTAAFCGKGLTDAKIARFDPSVKLLDNTLSQTDSEFSNLDLFSAVINTGNDHVFFGLNDTRTNSRQSTAGAPQYVNTSGESYLMRLPQASTTPSWDSYFGHASGQTADQVTPWSVMNPIVEGKGNLAYSSSLDTYFAFASCEDNPVETQAKNGFFSESIISATPSSSGAEMYVASFSDNSFSNNYFYWGTIFGGDGDDIATDIIVYEDNGTPFIITTGIAFSEKGTSSSNDDDFPVSNFGGNSHFQQDNSTPSSSGFSDVVVSRFEITDVNISLEEDSRNPIPVRIYPNPTASVVRITLDESEEKLEIIQVYDITGKLVMTSRPDSAHDHLAELNLSILPSGMYTVSVNERYNEKIIKL